MPFDNRFAYQGQRDAERKPHGVGTLLHGGQLLYRGEFEHGSMTGRGYRVYMDGSSYSGAFHDGMRHGYGIWTSADGAVVRQGTFRADVFHGALRAWRLSRVNSLRGPPNA
ncbi:hypothetical protein PTSG_00179 [Salpingoeca rosetta]|uniref:Uncharacterized protein n=1 Tax=Salpingoeca rosetta (strain ATCC 50818 / BSB-021) TaxID=946362 RepID=F2TVR2_SALR5|nr:uncharacterized protein PTSG_00179 [Salpingoeca rosetta]EGD72158.1 hypothetical protein PTSG_00179 [Salpingoeca rosetta]|eukprot:XP_004998730.1 hypothetical protein PTSG_00179 [Salpingoeca rosetta]